MHLLVVSPWWSYFEDFLGVKPLSRKLRWRSFEQKRENVYSEMLPGEPSTIGSDMLTARL